MKHPQGFQHGGGRRAVQDLGVLVGHTVMRKKLVERRAMRAAQTLLEFLVGKRQTRPRGIQRRQAGRQPGEG